MFVDGGKSRLMDQRLDPRLEAFRSPEFHRVFAAVASLPGAANEELLDVSSIQPQVSAAILSIVRQAAAQNDPASRLLLIRGQTGVGKTHALVTVIRQLHQQHNVFGAVLPVIDPVSEAEFDSWLTRSVVTRLSETFLAGAGKRVPLQRLAESLLELAPRSMGQTYRVAASRGSARLREAEFRTLVQEVRAILAGPMRVNPASEPYVAALLATLAGDDAAMDYLSGAPVDAVVAGVRLHNPDSAFVPRTRFAELLGVIGALGGSLFIAFDQLEQSHMEGWQERVRNVACRGAMLAETLPNLAVAFAILPTLYDTIAKGIDPSIRDRIEKIQPPVHLKPLSRREVEALLGRRLRLLYDRAGAEAAPNDPLFPFKDWFLEELSGQTSRYVTEYVQIFQRLLNEKGRLPELRDFPATDAAEIAIDSTSSARTAPPVESAPVAPVPQTGQAPTEPASPKPSRAPSPASAPALPPAPPRSVAPAADFAAKWEHHIGRFAGFRPLGSGLQQAELLGWAAAAAAAELDNVSGVRVHKDIRGRAQTVVLIVEIEVEGRLAERREVALLNEPNSGRLLADEIRGFLASCRDSRPVLVRPMGARLPKGGRGVGPMLDAIVEKGAIVVRSFEKTSWERLQAAEEFFRHLTDLPGFNEWQQKAKPLSRISCFDEIIAFPYVAPAAEAKKPAPAPAAAPSRPEPAPARPARRPPSGPSVFLGAGKDGEKVHWSPYSEEPRLPNFGVLVTGDSGSGKTQTLRVLIDGVNTFRCPMCIFDFKNDYADAAFVRAQGLKVHDVRRSGIPFNPLLPAAGEDGKAQPIEHIFTICGVLKRVFGLGDRQAAVLRECMKQAFEFAGVNPQRWAPVETLTAPSFDDVMSILYEQREQKNSIASGLIDRIAPLFELGLFPKSQELSAPFEAMVDERLVLSLFELPTDEIKAALAELIIIRLHNHLVRGAQPRKLTRLLVLDEAWRVSRSAHLENLAREGRAFGVGLAIGTQYPGDLPPDLAGSLATKIYLKNQQPDHKRTVVRALCGSNTGAQAAEIYDLLDRLEVFEGVIQNQQCAPFSAFRLHPYYARQKTREQEAREQETARAAANGDPVEMQQKHHNGAEIDCA
jgi:hypothetical protein